MEGALVVRTASSTVTLTSDGSEGGGDERGGGDGGGHCGSGDGGNSEGGVGDSDLQWRQCG